MPERSEVPEGWVSVPLGNVISPSKEKIEPLDCPELKYIGLEHIESNKCRILGNGSAGDTKSTKTLFHSGDLLYGKLRPYLNKVCVPEFEGVCSTDILVFKQSPYLNNCYLMWFLSAPGFVDYANNNSSGVQLPRVNFQKLSSYRIPLPPLPEQHRIVAAIEALFARLDAANARFDRVPGILKRFRQAVLAAACDGRLTEEWRANNSKIETAFALLRRLGGDSAEVTVPSDLDPITPPNVPDTWIWSRCERFCDPKRAITYGVIKLGPPQDGGIPTLRSSDVRWLYIDDSHVKAISPNIAANYSRTFLEGGEILVTVRGTLGGVAVVPPHMSGYNISREVAMVPILPGLNSQFLCYAIASQWSQNWLSEVERGVTYIGINIRDLKSLPLPLPPLPEQHEIVRRVDALFALADRIETEVAVARGKTETMRRSILAQAFSGRLVSTEAELARQEGRGYEPASVLLERIRSEKKTGKKGVQSTPG